MSRSLRHTLRITSENDKSVSPELALRRAVMNCFYDDQNAGDVVQTVSEVIGKAVDILDAWETDEESQQAQDCDNFVIKILEATARHLDINEALFTDTEAHNVLDELIEDLNKIRKDYTQTSKPAKSERTPCQQRGWKPGDIFRVTTNELSVPLGSVCRLHYDDGTRAPYFHHTLGSNTWKDGTTGLFIPMVCVTKLADKTNDKQD